MTSSQRLSRLPNRILDLLAEIAAFVSQAMLAVMVAIMVIGVFSRYALNRPLAFVDEYVMYLMAGVSLLAAGYVLREKGHISVDIVTNLLPEKTKLWLRVITDFISVFCIGVILVQMVRLTQMTLETGSVSNTALHTPIGPIQAILPIAFTLLFIEFVRTTVNSVKSSLSVPGH